MKPWPARRRVRSRREFQNRHRRLRAATESFLQIAMNLYGTGINLTGADAASSASRRYLYQRFNRKRKDKVIEPIWRLTTLLNAKPDTKSLNGYVCNDIFDLNNPASCQNVKTDEQPIRVTNAHDSNARPASVPRWAGGVAMGDAVITKITDDSIMAHLADNTIVLSPERARFLNALPRETVALLSQAATASDNTTKAASLTPQESWPVKWRPSWYRR